MTVIIDRFEGDFVIIELPDSKTLEVPRELFLSAKEGDVFTITKNTNQTNERKKLIQEKFDRLKK